MLVLEGTAGEGMELLHPACFSPQVRDLLEHAHESFCANVAPDLSAALGAPLQLTVSGLEEQPLAEALASLRRPSVQVVLSMRPGSAPLLVAIEEGALRRFVLHLLGGRGDEQLGGQTALTQLELTLAHRLVSLLADRLSDAWQALLEVSLTLEAVELREERIHLGSPTETVLSISIDVLEQDSVTSLVVVVPHRAMEQALPRPAAPEPAEAEPLRAALASMDVEVRAELPAVELPLEQVLALRPGDVVRLGSRASEGVVLVADGVAVHRALPGRSGDRRAARVVGRLEAR